MAVIKEVTKKPLVIMALLLALGAQAACYMHDNNSLAFRPDEVKTKLTDSELEAAIQTQFDRDRSFSEIRLFVDAENDQVVLTGSVEREAQRTQAIEIARNGNADLLITVLIQVKLPER